MSCPDRHARDDPQLGEPLCPDCYDYTGSVLFNACAPELWRRFTATESLAELPVSEHARRLIGTCLRPGRLPELADLWLAAWSHMLGFRGHFSTKSRHYSTTFGALRAERAQHQRDHAPTESLWPDPEPEGPEPNEGSGSFRCLETPH